MFGSWSSAMRPIPTLLKLYVRKKIIDYNPQACNERSYVFGTLMTLFLFFDTNERKTLMHISYLERIILTALFLFTYIRVWFTVSVITLEYKHVFNLFCNYFAQLHSTKFFQWFVNWIYLFQATGNKELQHHRDQNSSMYRAIRGWFGAAYRHCSLEEEVNTGISFFLERE